MRDETKEPYFTNLPVWLQKQIITERNREIEREQERARAREQSIMRQCDNRGYGLLPTRGDLALPPHRRARRSVGDYSIMEWEG